MRFLVRMCLDLRFYVTGNKADIVERVLDVCRMLGLQLRAYGLKRGFSLVEPA